MTLAAHCLEKTLDWRLSVGPATDATPLPSSWIWMEPFQSVRVPNGPFISFPATFAAGRVAPIVRLHILKWHLSSITPALVDRDSFALYSWKVSDFIREQDADPQAPIVGFVATGSSDCDPARFQHVSGMDFSYQVS